MGSRSVFFLRCIATIPIQRATGSDGHTVYTNREQWVRLRREHHESIDALNVLILRIYATSNKIWCQCLRVEWWVRFFR